MTITIENLIHVGNYEVNIVPCSIKDPDSGRYKDGMCVNVREWDMAVTIEDSELIAVAVGHTLDEVMNFIEKQMDEKGLIPLRTR